MNLRARSKSQIAGGLFIIVGLMNLLTADFLLGLVWGLLGVSMLAYVPGRAGAGITRSFEPSPRNYLALAAVILAIILLIVSFVGVV